MQIKRSQFLALSTAALAAPLLGACGAKRGAAVPSSAVAIDPEGEIEPREVSWLLSAPPMAR